MNKFISVPTSGRTHYVRKFLESLHNSNPNEPWMLSFSADSIPMSKFDLIFEHATRIVGPPFEIMQNHKQLGADRNFYASANRCFAAGADAVLHVDDDMVLSPDALDLCDWYLAREHRHDEIGLCLCNEVSSDAQPTAISRNDTWRGLVGQGYLFTRKQWDSFIRETHANIIRGFSYDWSLIVVAMEACKVILRPTLSRSQHIGVEGLHGAAAGVHIEPFPAIFSHAHYAEPFHILP